MESVNFESFKSEKTNKNQNKSQRIFPNSSIRRRWSRAWPGRWILEAAVVSDTVANRGDSETLQDGTAQETRTVRTRAEEMEKRNTG